MIIRFYQEENFLGDLKMPKNVKLFKFNNRTKIPIVCKEGKELLEPREGHQNTDLILDLEVHKNYKYIPAINKKNAVRKYNKNFLKK